MKKIRRPNWEKAFRCLALKHHRIGHQLERMFLQIIGVIFGVLLVAFVAGSFFVSQPLFEEKISRTPDSAFTLAPVEQALSFARTKNGKSLLVVAINRAGIQAIDLAAATTPRREGTVGFFARLR